MRLLVYISLFLISSFCFINQQERDEKGKEKLTGFVFINLSKIYYNSGSVSILDIKKDTILSVENKTVSIYDTTYETIEEEKLYRKHVNIEVLDPEYGFFILKCFGLSKKFYKVEINNAIGYIPKNIDKEYAIFKNFQEYIMESYPIPTEKNPLRKEAKEKSAIINDFVLWTYLPIEIKGDWLKVKDDKNCYKGVSPSPVDITGWIRWRKNGKFILKVAHSC